MGWDGMGWDGMGWDGMGWDGMGWDAMYECRSVTSVNTMWFTSDTPTHLENFCLVQNVNHGLCRCCRTKHLDSETYIDWE
jgi:hypothetical protein